MRPSRLLTSVLLLVSALVLVLAPGGCKPVLPEIGFEAEEDAGRLAIHVEALAETTTHLVYGKPWEGEDPILPYAPGAAFKMGGRAGGGLGFKSLQSMAIPPGTPLEVKLAADFLPEGEGVVQLVATREPRISQGTEFLGLSRAFIVKRAGESLEVRPFGEILLARHGATAVLMWVVFAVVVLLLWLFPTRRLPGGWSGRIVVVLILAACLAPRLLAPEEDRRVLERGAGVMPMFWPRKWEAGGDGWERDLGPGFRALWDRALALHEQTGEPIHIRSPLRQGIALKRAVCLERLIPEARFLQYGSHPPPGLVVSFSLPTLGEALLETTVGTLARIARKDGR